MHKKSILFINFKKSKNFIFLIVKMAAKYAEIGMVHASKLEADF